MNWHATLFWNSISDRWLNPGTALHVKFQETKSIFLQRTLIFLNVSPLASKVMSEKNLPDGLTEVRVRIFGSRLKNVQV